MSDQGHGGGAPSWRDITVRPYHRRRDWRWWVGGIGRVLVAAGLLLLAFVGYRKVKQVRPPDKAIHQGKEIPRALKGHSDATSGPVA